MEPSSTAAISSHVPADQPCGPLNLFPICKRGQHRPRCGVEVRLLGLRPCRPVRSSGCSVVLALQSPAVFRGLPFSGGGWHLVVPPDCPREKPVGSYRAWTLGLVFRSHMCKLAAMLPSNEDIGMHSKGGEGNKILSKLFCFIFKKNILNMFLLFVCFFS